MNNMESVPTRDGLDAVPRYAPGRSAAAVDLSDSTNVWGAAPSAVNAIAQAARESWRYPAMYSEPLTSVLGAYHGVSASSVITGCGSDEILRSAFNAYGGPGAVITWMEPTFVMTPVFAALLGLDARPVRMTSERPFDADALLATNAAVTYLCSPNNPTGNLVPRAELLRVIDQARGLVVLDEAYADYSGETLIREAAERPNLVVARTFSKSFGLAGLRVGYGVAHPRLVTAMERARGPYTVNLLAELAASAAITHDVAWMQARVSDAIAMRERLARELEALGFAPFASLANFILVPVKDPARFSAACERRGVLVRAFASLPFVGPAVRIAAAPWDTLQKVVDAARQVGA